MDCNPDIVPGFPALADEFCIRKYVPTATTVKSPFSCNPRQPNGLSRAMHGDLVTGAVPVAPITHGNPAANGNRI
jgi:hypothetical protein